MLTKEECKEALKVIISRGGGVEELLYWTYAMPDAINTLNNLIDEHFDNPPLTIDELEPDQEVYFKSYGETVLIRGVDKEKNLVFLSAIDRKCELEYEFEPNDFYRKRVE